MTSPKESHVSSPEPLVLPADTVARAAGLIAAALIAPPGASVEEITTTAGQLAGWVLPRHLVVTVSRRTWPQASAGQPRPTTYTPGGAVQLKDTQQFTISIDPKDSKGFDTSDNFTYTVDDGSVVSLQPADDTQSCLIVAGAPGSTVVTISDGVLSATEAVDVVAGDVATISITEGDVEDQPTA
jgi:hypothetical protein